MSKFEDKHITAEFLDATPDCFFVFGDNLKRTGKGGAAALRDHQKAIGFATKKAPSNENGAFFTVEEYTKLFFSLLDQLEELVKNHQGQTFYISKLGAGLANKHLVWEKLIRHNLIEALEKYPNVVFCWEDDRDHYDAEPPALVEKT
jgi:hypothetical protein